jgi:glycosyltransferase involved in cell wall biosynthesis
VLAAWDRALFGVLPSLLPEPLGTVVCEGMTRGKAVIGTRPGGHSDVLTDGVTGLVVPSGDAASLTAAMRKLIDDSVLREQLGEAARIHARSFAMPVVLDQFEALYRELVAAA